MALSNRDCPHGRQAGQCSDCDVSELERQIEQDEALIRQMKEALEHIHRCIPMGGFAQIHWDSASFEQIVQAAEAGRARLEGKQ